MKSALFALLSLSLSLSILIFTPDSACASTLAKSIQKNLVAVDGNRVRKHDAPTLPQAEYVALYYTASWCPPCRKFTPKLVEFYHEQKKLHGDRFEVVLVSSDRDEKSMEKYLTDASMPWPAIRFRDIERSGVLEHAGKGIPCLVVFDKEGKVLSHSYVDGKYVGPSKVMEDLAKLLKKDS